MERKRASHHLEPEQHFKDLTGNAINSKIKWALSDSFHLRLLIHYVGDIHQPLHATSRFSPDFPNGDQGGNAFKLKIDHELVTNLHALWDSVLLTQDSDFKLPLDQSDWAKLGAISEKLRKTHPLDNFKEDLKVPNAQWGEETYDIAAKYIYAGIDVNGAPSKAYLEQGQQIAERQITKAGYRLA